MGAEKDLAYVMKVQKEITHLGRISALLGWDQQTHMPKKGLQGRAEQGAYLSSLIHEKVISDDFFNAIKRLMKANLSGDEKIMIERLFKDVSKARKLPKEFIQEISLATTKGFSTWLEAREKDDFKIF